MFLSFSDYIQTFLRGIHKYLQIMESQLFGFLTYWHPMTPFRNPLKLNYNSVIYEMESH
uniref:Uncharacterized protein n=1 Tax=Anguilla anguilla TaxID=7936 RepID=A0A0E9WI32_ANGAN